MSFFKLTYLSVLTLSMVFTVAETEERKPSEVFPKNFAKGWNSDSDIESPKTGSFSPDPLPQSKTKIFNKDLIQKKDELDESVVEPEILKVNSLGAVIWIGDEDHYESKSSEFLDLVTKFKLPVSTVYLIGPPKNSISLFKEMYQKIIHGDHENRLESNIMLSRQKYLPNLPKELESVKYSPTWLVETEHGLVLVEGSNKSLSVHFTNDGKFKLFGYKIKK